MSMRARRPRRKTWQDYYQTSAWQARRRAVWTRAAGRCEFCLLRPLEHVHHRTYARFGKEPLDDLMGVDAVCHRYIHHRGRKGTCATGSLMARGDSGKGHSALWLRYLATQRRRDAA